MVLAGLLLLAYREYVRHRVLPKLQANDRLLAFERAERRKPSAKRNRDPSQEVEPAETQQGNPLWARQTPDKAEEEKGNEPTGYDDPAPQQTSERMGRKLWRHMDQKLFSGKVHWLYGKKGSGRFWSESLLADFCCCTHWYVSSEGA